jgi:methylthioribose-1-phosphate isomerase
MRITHSDAIGWSAAGGVRLLDQTLLPDTVRYLEIDDLDRMVEAIGTLRVRGAPLIGIAAAMGLAAAAERRAAGAGDAAGAAQPRATAGLTVEWLRSAASRLAAARPTAVNLSWAVERMRRVGDAALEHGDAPTAVAARLRAEAQAIWDEDAAMCAAIGDAGAELVPAGATILTHCNTGQLATGGIGTAFGVILAAHRQGKGIDVIADETRPLRQGARLTAWELSRAAIPARVIVDGAAGAVMAGGEVDLVITGADRIAANGDAANKIGTYALAVLARAHGIPFYVAAPWSTFDLSLASGDAIPIEQRAAEEIVGPVGGARAYNPAFDVTPAELITAIVTDRGVLRPPYAASIVAVGGR